MNEQELKGFIEESRKTGRLLTLSIVINIISLEFSIFALFVS